MTMKKTFRLLLMGLLAIQACQKDEFPETYEDADLTGSPVDVSAFPASVRKVFVLNEGGMGSGNASLDFIRTSDGHYVTGAFKKMNPSVGAGLGDVGNDIAVKGDEVWIVVNNSGIVEVISAKDEKEIAAITVPTPRNIAFDDKYAYVTSWAGAYINGSFDGNGDFSFSGSANPKGKVYRINLKTKKVDGAVEVGFQPEGIAWTDGKLYVANSGGISSQLPPLWSYDNTVSIIDAASFKVVKTVEVAVNLKSVYADADGHVYVTSLGDYGKTHSAVYEVTADFAVKIADYVSVSTFLDGTLYCLGTENEFDWFLPRHTFTGFRVKKGVKASWNLPVEAASLSGLCAVDLGTFLVCDSGDYFNPGTVSCFAGGSLKWSVTAGVCPGHFAVW